MGNAQDKIVEACKARIYEGKIEGHNIPLGNKGLRQLVAELRLRSNIRTVELSGCHIGDKGVLALCTFLQQHSLVETIVLTDNPRIDGEATRQLCLTLVDHEKILTLDLMNNKMTVDCACHIGLLLKKSASLRELRLGENLFGPSGVAAIAEGAACSESLTSLDLEHTGVGDLGAEALGNMLQQNETLQELFLRYNQIDSSGCRALSKGLQENHALRVLDLDANEIGFEGIAELALMLTVNNTLQKLVLSSMPLGLNGAVVLTQALLHNQSLTSLNLNAVGLGDEGVRRIAMILPKNQTLTELSLSTNHIEDPGAEALLTGMHRNTSLREVHIRKGNNISANLLSDISAVLKANCSVQALARIDPGAALLRKQAHQTNDAADLRALSSGDGPLPSLLPQNAQRLMEDREQQAATQAATAAPVDHTAEIESNVAAAQTRISAFRTEQERLARIGKTQGQPQTAPMPSASPTAQTAGVSPQQSQRGAHTNQLPAAAWPAGKDGVTYATTLAVTRGQGRSSSNLESLPDPAPIPPTRPLPSLMAVRPMAKYPRRPRRVMIQPPLQPPALRGVDLFPHGAKPRSNFLRAHQRTAMGVRFADQDGSRGRQRFRDRAMAQDGNDSDSIDEQPDIGSMKSPGEQQSAAARSAFRSPITTVATTAASQRKRSQQRESGEPVLPPVAPSKPRRETSLERPLKPLPDLVISPPSPVPTTRPGDPVLAAATATLAAPSDSPSSTAASTTADTTSDVPPVRPKKKLPKLPVQDPSPGSIAAPSTVSSLSDGVQRGESKQESATQDVSEVPKQNDDGEEDWKQAEREPTPSLAEVIERLRIKNQLPTPSPNHETKNQHQASLPWTSNFFAEALEHSPSAVGGNRAMPPRLPTPTDSVDDTIRMARIMCRSFAGLGQSDPSPTNAGVATVPSIKLRRPQDLNPSGAVRMPPAGSAKDGLRAMTLNINKQPQADLGAGVGDRHQLQTKWGVYSPAEAQPVRSNTPIGWCGCR